MDLWVGTNATVECSDSILSLEDRGSGLCSSRTSVQYLPRCSHCVTTLKTNIEIHV
jgi:hypothetical protein